jgi:hypothetical protein
MYVILAAAIKIRHIGKFKCLGVCESQNTYFASNIKNIYTTIHT